MRIVITALLLGVFLTGCMLKKQEQSIEIPQIKTEEKKLPTPINRPFREKILVGKIRNADTNDGYCKALVPVKNLTNESLVVLYRFKWYNINGSEVSAPNQNMWNTIVIIAKDEIVLSSSAPEKKCNDVKLLIKEAVRK